MQKQNCNLPIGRKNSLSRVSKVTCGLLFCLTTCAFAVDGKVNMGSNGVDDKKVVPLVGTTKTKLDGVNQEGFKVKGQVSDNVGPLPGVNVMVKGTMTGVITDMDGNFEIVAPYSKATLVFSYVGYQPKEVSLKGERIVNVKMVEDAKALEEVVVVGYTTQRKATITGSVATITTKDLKLTDGFSDACPRLVVITTTPFAPRIPYAAVAEASFKIVNVSISSGAK